MLVQTRGGGGEDATSIRYLFSMIPQARQDAGGSFRPRTHTNIGAWIQMEEEEEEEEIQRPSNACSQ